MGSVYGFQRPLGEVKKEKEIVVGTIQMNIGIFSKDYLQRMRREASKALKEENRKYRERRDVGNTTEESEYFWKPKRRSKARRDYWTPETRRRHGLIMKEIMLKYWARLRAENDTKRSKQISESVKKHWKELKDSGNTERNVFLRKMMVNLWKNIKAKGSTDRLVKQRKTQIKLFKKYKMEGKTHKCIGNVQWVKQQWVKAKQGKIDLVDRIRAGVLSYYAQETEEEKQIRSQKAKEALVKYWKKLKEQGSTMRMKVLSTKMKLYWYMMKKGNTSTLLQLAERVKNIGRT
ncbi:hypothetical protein WDU94_002867 [Cyamophila willieti]